MKITYTVGWDNSNGTDWDETFDNLRVAYNFYKRLKAPYKDLVFTDRDGDHTLVTSKGDNNLNKYFCLVDYD